MIEDVTVRRCTSPGKRNKNNLKQRWYEMCYHDVVEWEKRGRYADEFDAIGLIPSQKELADMREHDFPGIENEN